MFLISSLSKEATPWCQVSCVRLQLCVRDCFDYSSVILALLVHSCRLNTTTYIQQSISTYVHGTQ